MHVGFVEFEKPVNVWDVHAGRSMPDIEVFEGATLDVWAALAEDLSQSAWRPSTRRLYQGWLAPFLLLCKVSGVPALPIQVGLVEYFITTIAARYAFGTVQIAASALIGFCALNNHQNPFKEQPRLKLLLKATKSLQAGALRDKKKAIDPDFVIKMWEKCAEIEEKSKLRIVDQRARCFCQLAFEAALRGGEIRQLKMCDLIFIGCDERSCGKAGKCGSMRGKMRGFLCG